MPETKGSRVPWCIPVNGLAVALIGAVRTWAEAGPRVPEHCPNRPKAGGNAIVQWSA
jgi:hypothetical protein